MQDQAVGHVVEPSRPVALERRTQQAQLAELIPYGPTNTKANALIPAATLAVLPTGPDNFPGTIFVDQSWWAANGQSAYDAFNEWLLG